MLVTALLKHEQKMSVVHYSIQRSACAEQPVAALRRPL
jgi:hypothetical protein